jgi:urea ABC transporter substrate-binding protein
MPANKPQKTDTEGGTIECQGKENTQTETGRSRRNVLAGVGVAITGSLAGCGGVTGSASSDETITVGILEDQSGNFGAVGTPKWKASKLAVEEINNDGGIMGKQIEVVDPDPQSDDTRYQKLTRELITENDIDALWAGYASSSREAIRPIINDAEQLYFYTTLYEGGVCDRYTFPVGSTPRQQLGMVLPYLVENVGSQIYTIAANYNYGSISAEWARILSEEHGAEVIAEEFVPLSQKEFGGLLDRIERAEPDFIMSMLVGQNHENFYTQKARRGLETPIGTPISMSSGYEHLRLEPPAMANVYAGVNYMEELPNDRNQEFVDRFYEKYPDAAYLNQEAQNNYFSIHLYKQAVEAAGTTEQAAVIDELESGMEIDAPEGEISLDGATHHVNHNMRVAKADANHDISFVAERQIDETFLSETVACNLRETPETRQYVPDDYFRGKE